MEVFTKHKKLAAALRDKAVCEKHFGANMTKKLVMRVASLQAADSLSAFWPPNSGPERCHELKADRKGVFSVDLNQPYRLLFKALENDQFQDRQDERTRWASITKIELIGIEDTHGRQ